MGPAHFLEVCPICVPTSVHLHPFFVRISLDTSLPQGYELLERADLALFVCPLRTRTACLRLGAVYRIAGHVWNGSCFSRK